MPWFRIATSERYWLATASPAASSPEELMRSPLDSRVNALFNPRLVCCRFAWALIDARLLTTENEAMERFLLEARAASLRLRGGPCRLPCRGGNREPVRLL